MVNFAAKARAMRACWMTSDDYWQHLTHITPTIDTLPHAHAHIDPHMCMFLRTWLYEGDATAVQKAAGDGP